MSWPHYDNNAQQDHTEPNSANSIIRKILFILSTLITVNILIPLAYHTVRQPTETDFRIEPKWVETTFVSSFLILFGAICLTSIIPFFFPEHAKSLVIRARHIPLTLTGAFFTITATVNLATIYFFPKYCETVNYPLGYLYLLSFIPYPVRVIRLVKVFSLKGGINDPMATLNFLNIYQHWIVYQQSVYTQLRQHLTRLKREKIPVECIYCLHSQPHTYSCTQHELNKSTTPWSGLESKQQQEELPQPLLQSTSTIIGTEARSIDDHSTVATATPIIYNYDPSNNSNRKSNSHVVHNNDNIGNSMFSFDSVGSGFAYGSSTGKNGTRINNETAIQRAREALQDPHSFEAQQYMNLLTQNFTTNVGGDDDMDLDPDGGQIGRLGSLIEQNQLGVNNTPPQQLQMRKIFSYHDNNNNTNDHSHHAPGVNSQSTREQIITEQTVVRYLLRHQSVSEISTLSTTISETLSRPQHPSTIPSASLSPAISKPDRFLSIVPIYDVKTGRQLPPQPQLLASEAYEFTTCLECSCVSVFEASHDSLNNHLFTVYDYYSHNLHIEQDLATAYDQYVSTARAGLGKKKRPARGRANADGSLNESLLTSESTIDVYSSNSISSSLSFSNPNTQNQQQDNTLFNCSLHKFDTLESRHHFQVDSFFDAAPNANNPIYSSSNSQYYNGSIHHSQGSRQSGESNQQSSLNPHLDDDYVSINQEFTFSSKSPLEQFHRCSARYIVRLSLIILIFFGLFLATANYLLSGFISPQQDGMDTHYFCNNTTPVGPVTIFSIIAHGVHILAFFIFLRLVQSVWSIYSSASEFKVIMLAHGVLLVLHAAFALFRARLPIYSQRFFFWSMALRLTANITALLVTPLTQVSGVPKPQLVQVDENGAIVDKDFAGKSSSSRQNDEYSFDLLDVGFGSNQEPKLMQLRVPKKVTEIRIFDLIHRYIDSHLAIISLALHRDFLAEQHQQQLRNSNHQYQLNGHFSQYHFQSNDGRDDKTRLSLENLLFSGIDQSIVRAIAATGQHLGIDLRSFYNMKPQVPPSFDVLIRSSLGYSSLLSFLQHGVSGQNAHLLLYCYVHVQSILLLVVNLMETMQIILNLTHEHNLKVKEKWDFDQFSIDLDNDYTSTASPITASTSTKQSGFHYKAQPQFIQPTVTVELQQMLIYLLGCCESFASFYLENHSHSSQHPPSISIINKSSTTNHSSQAQTFTYPLLDCILCVITSHLSGSFCDVTRALLTHLTTLSAPKTITLPAHYCQGQQQTGHQVQFDHVASVPTVDHQRYPSNMATSFQAGDLGFGSGNFGSFMNALVGSQSSVQGSGSQKNNGGLSPAVLDSPHSTLTGTFQTPRPQVNQPTTIANTPFGSPIAAGSNFHTINKGGRHHEPDDMSTPEFTTMLSVHSKLPPIQLSSPVQTNDRNSSETNQSTYSTSLHNPQLGRISSSRFNVEHCLPSPIPVSGALDIVNSSFSAQPSHKQALTTKNSNSNKVPAATYLDGEFQRDFSLLLDKNNVSSMMNRSFLIKKHHAGLVLPAIGGTGSPASSFVQSSSFVSPPLATHNNSVVVAQQPTPNRLLPSSRSRSNFATGKNTGESIAPNSRPVNIPANLSDNDEDDTKFDANTGQIALTPKPYPQNSQIPINDFIFFYTQAHNLSQFQATTQLVTSLYNLLKELEKECTNAIASHYSLFANSLHWKLLYYRIITINHWCNILHVCDLTEELIL